MSDTLQTRYDHNESEKRIYDLWEKSGLFNPDKLSLPVDAKPYTIIMPPTNANGALHVGHAVGLTLQDILIRFWRMRGRRTLWLPGADHAGFETQVVYDKKLDKEGRDRRTMRREELWQEIWDFTQANKERMYAQTKKLGASCDWSREAFTLDPKIVAYVYETFGKLYKDGLVYRDLRVVNWCTKHKTALSDLETRYEERPDPLYYIAYGPLTVATVRPETKFGDTGLAVNPKDKRYKKYIGKTIEAEGLLGPLAFKVVADDAVDPTFGTGVVKITPAHDATDFEMWQKHKKEIPGPKIVIDENGKLTGDVGPYRGLKVAEARARIVEDMKKKGILGKVDMHYTHQVATCYKCGNILEPLPKPQWFVKTKPLAAPAIKAATLNNIKFFPAHSRKIYLRWLKNIHDWNISRQIVWGIRIPAWFCASCRAVKVSPRAKARWFLVRHAESEWNKNNRIIGNADAPLSDNGIAQAKALAKALSAHKIDVVITSDLSRARDTAHIIASKTGARLTVDSALRERNMGIVQGMPNEYGTAHFGDELLEKASKVPGGESWSELDDRAWQAFKKYTKIYRDKNIVFVSHTGPVRSIVQHVRNADSSDLHVANAAPIEFDILDPCDACKGEIFEQDPDVFDTWFSSGQWPVATLKRHSQDFDRFYPTDVMETGHDILLFWVSRMVMLALYRTGTVPFRTIYLHGLVRDKDKQKMSKSKGNVMDPLGVAETYGTDALRMALVMGNTAGRDQSISEEKIKGFRNFATKIWNISRFILMNKPASMPRPWILLTKEDKATIKACATLKKKITRHIERFEFHRAAEAIYHYTWHTFADKIIEKEKPRLKAGAGARVTAYFVLEHILTECLTMLHPFMPYVTEEIYQNLHASANGPADSKKNLLMACEWEKA